MVQHAATQTMDGLVVYRFFGVHLTPGVAGWRRARRSSIPGSLRQGVPRQGEQAMPPGLTLDVGR